MNAPAGAELATCLFENVLATRTNNHLFGDLWVEFLGIEQSENLNPSAQVQEKRCISPANRPTMVRTTKLTMSRYSNIP